MKPTFDSSLAYRRAVERLPATYTRAVSTRDQALSETILLDRDVPFAYVGSILPAGTSSRSTRAYEEFREGVFEGPSFRQTFYRVRIEGDGTLAQVPLIFPNTSECSAGWGCKTMQLVKVDGVWKNASEFFTAHDGVGPPDDAAPGRSSEAARRSDADLDGRNAMIVVRHHGKAVISGTRGLQRSAAVVAVSFAELLFDEF